MNSLLKEYDLGIIHSFKHIKTGVFNKNYLVNTSKGKFVARISNKIRTLKEVNFEIELLKQLNNLKVPKVIKNKKNQLVTQTNSKIIVVSHYVEGENPTKITDDILREVGEFLGKYHAASKDFIFTTDRATVYEFTNKKLEEMKVQLKKDLPKIKEEIEYIYQIVKKYRIPKSFPKGPCHLDMKPENSLVKNGKINLFLDFDNCEYNYLLLDVGRTLKWWCYDKQGYDERKISLILNEYEKYRPLSSEEKNYVKESIIFAIASQLYFIYYLFVHAWPEQEEFFNSYRKMFIPQIKKLIQKE